MRWCRRTAFAGMRSTLRFDVRIVDGSLIPSFSRRAQLQRGGHLRVGSDYLRHSVAFRVPTHGPHGLSRLDPISLPLRRGPAVELDLEGKAIWCVWRPKQ